MQAGNKIFSYVCLSSIVTILLLPLFVLFLVWGLEDDGALAHLMQTRLAGMVIQSLLLCIGAVFLSLLLGSVGAWLVTMIEFPGRRLLSILLMMPLALPAYVLAMIYGEWFDSAGAVQSWLRSMELIDGPIGSFRSLAGAIIILTLALYPYVYILARNALSSLPTSLYESALMLGMPRHILWYKVALPAIRPALVAGAALVAMESLADFGVISLYGVDTLTRGIYRSWFGMYDIVSAIKLASILVLIVLVALIIEKRSRRNMRYSSVNSAVPLQRWNVSSSKKIGAILFCMLLAMVSFILPLLQLVLWAFSAKLDVFDMMLTNVLHSITVASVTSVIALFIALYFSYAQRRGIAKWLSNMINISSYGYAVPGAVIAVALFLPLITLDKWMVGLAKNWFDISLPLIFTGTVAAIVFACVIRFLALSYGAVNSALLQVHMRYDEAAALLGTTGFSLWRKVHLPLIRSGCFMALIIVFVDTIKELPASLMLRPFNYNTLAIQTYELASDSRYVEAAVPALAMVSVSMIAMLILLRYSNQESTF